MQASVISDTDCQSVLAAVTSESLAKTCKLSVVCLHCDSYVFNGVNRQLDKDITTTF